MVMTLEAWTAIGTGVVILIVIEISHRHLHAEMKALRDEIRGEIHALRGEMNGGMKSLHGRMDRIRAEIGELRERMARLEGLLVGLREAITGRKAA